jgi:hypothetical protein
MSRHVAAQGDVLDAVGGLRTQRERQPKSQASDTRFAGESIGLNALPCVLKPDGVGRARGQLMAVYPKPPWPTLVVTPVREDL